MDSGKGYRVIAVTQEGLTNMDIADICCLNKKESEIDDFAYLGVAISYLCANTNNQQKMHTEKVPQGRRSTAAPNKDNTNQHIYERDSQIHCSSVHSSIDRQSPPYLSPVQNFLAGNNIDINFSQKTMPVLSPILTKCANINHKNGCSGPVSTASDTDDASFATALSDTTYTDMYLSVFNSTSNHADVLDDVGSLIDLENGDEFHEALETPFVDTDIGFTGFKSFSRKYRDVSERTGMNWRIVEHNDLRMKVRAIKDLNPEKYCTEKQTTDSSNSFLGNNFVTETEKDFDENKDNYNSFCMAKDDTRGQCRREMKSNSKVLDMQKYIIQKENIVYNKFESNSWDVDRSGITTQSRNSQLELSNMSPEGEARHPLESFFKKRKRLASKANINILSLFLCGCSVGKPKFSKEYRKKTKHRKKH